MKRIPILGLTGKAGAGKDMVYHRLVHLFGAGSYVQASFADPMKRSMAALLNVTVDQLEAMKNEPNVRVNIVDLKGGGREMGRSFSVRELMQRYGTDSHRNIFGDDFWVEHAMRMIDGDAPLPWSGKPKGDATIVFTDVRFDNEADAIIERGGIIVRVVGPSIIEGQSAADHVSEHGVSADRIELELDNETRPSFDDLSQGGQVAQDALDASVSALDDQVALLHELLTRDAQLVLGEG